MKLTLPPFLIAVTVFVVLAAVGSYFFVIPNYATLTQDNKSIADYVPIVTAKSTAVTTQQQQLAATKTTADTLLPSDNGEYDLSVQVEAECKNVGVTIQNMSFTAASTLPATTGIVPSTAGTTPNIALSLSVTGTYAQVQQLTSGLVSLNRYMQITALVLTGAQTAVGQSAASVATGTVTAQVSADAYYLPAAATPTPTPAP